MRSLLAQRISVKREGTSPRIPEQLYFEWIGFADPSDSPLRRVTNDYPAL